MAADLYVSFLGQGWSFPPRFEGDEMAMTAGVAMTTDEADIHASLEAQRGQHRISLTGELIGY